ncbi:MAG: hypothetical protein WBA00_12700 [Rhodococcus sp. (in: high G+C Gram-positive bacteria)]
MHPYDGVGSGSGSDVGPGPFLVWLIDDRDTVIIRSAASLAAAVEVARAYRDAWGGRVRYIEHPDGGVVAPDEWEPLLATPDPLPYVYTVELRTPRSAGCDELVSALWTSTDLDEAVRWRAMLPAALRARTLIVSNAPDGHYPRAASVPGQADVRS